MRPVASLSPFLLLLWLSNSGHYSALMLGLGGASILLVLFISDRMGLLGPPVPVRFARLPRYWLWLMAEIVKANIQVVRHIWLDPQSVNPAIGRLPLLQSEDLTRVVYANSITLTPGTITIRLDGDTIEVHALNASSLRELELGEMSQRVLALEP
ncbi:Na+/H+ antiporter subunit E [Ferrimonas balearica]|uniref:Na+/H+ antiporter subunit E n=1 Tax=Ferrimonas balearica TaxID=44012 RepID=UPI001C99604E|nr:Na+/H+ antiporter subunit E [Ferrimonas balearica]MBY5920778.1 Na+/H+ antiporter subunit E [Ferrimonas balearica]MBY5996537.1 Na+/H+ antiporter subunit E [Ferrimonas balearica]